MTKGDKISSTWGWMRALALIIMIFLVMATFIVGYFAHHVFRENLIVGQVPLSWAAAIIPGPVAVKGTVWPVDNQTLQGRLTKQPCLYYRYLEEEEETDSDGDTSWHTVEDESRFVPMRMTDATGEVDLVPDSAQFRAKEVHSFRRGDRRYTEWAIRPSDELFVLGKFAGEVDAGKIAASRDLPLVISNLGEREYRASKGSSAVFLCIAAVAMATFSICLACIVFKWHHVAVYLGLVALLVPTWMFSQWFLLVSTELGYGHEVLRSAEQQIKKESPDTLRSALVKQTFNDGARRYNRYRAKWMNRVVAYLGSRPQMSGMPLSEAEKKLASEFPFRPRPEISLNRWIGIVLVGIGLVMLLLLVRFGFRSLKTKRLIENVPTSPAAGVVVGLTEVKGRAVKQEDWLTSRYAKQQCCWYRYQKQVKRGSGKNSKWVTVASGLHGMPFTLLDDSGTIQVDPDKATVTGRRVFRERSGNTIRTEWAVDEEDLLYLLGPAGLKSPDDDFLTIAYQKEDRFLVSVESERTIMLRFAAIGFLLLNISLIGGTTAVLSLFSIGRFDAFDFFLSALFPPLYLVGLVTAFLYNDLVYLRERMRRALAMIDVALKKRSDLVPQLVDVVKGYLQHEKDVLQMITQMRTHPADSMDARERSDTLHASGEQAFLAIVEQYPDLKANRLVTRLQKRLATLENEIAFARAGYNDSVERYNTRIGSLPEVILARTFLFRQADLFETRNRQAVQVSL